MPTSTTSGTTVSRSAIRELGEHARLCQLEGDKEQEPAYCIQCGARNAIWDEVCRQCGGPKKWVYPRDMTPEEIEAGRRRLYAYGKPAQQRERPQDQRGR